MKTFRTILAILALGLITYTLIEFNYNDLSWQANRSNYLRIISMALLFIGLLLGNISDSKKIKKT